MPAKMNDCNSEKKMHPSDLSKASDAVCRSMATKTDESQTLEDLDGGRILATSAVPPAVAAVLAVAHNHASSNGYR